MGNTQIQTLSNIVLAKKKANKYLITTKFGRRGRTESFVVDWDGDGFLKLLGDEDTKTGSTDTCVIIEIKDTWVYLHSLLYLTEKPEKCYHYQESGYAKYLLSQINEISIKLNKQSTMLQDASYSRLCGAKLTPYLWSTRGFGFYHSYGYLWRFNSLPTNSGYKPLGTYIDDNIDKNNDLINQITMIIQIKSWLNDYIDKLAQNYNEKTSSMMDLSRKYKYDLLKQYEGKSIMEISKETKSDILKVIDGTILEKIDSYTFYVCNMSHRHEYCETYHEYYTIPVKTKFIKKKSGIGGHFELHYRTNELDTTRSISTNCFTKYWVSGHNEPRSKHKFILDSLYIHQDSKWTYQNIVTNTNHLKLFRLRNSEFKICLTGSYGNLKFTRYDPLFWCFKPTYIIQYTNEQKFELVLDSEDIIHPFIRGETKQYNPFLTINVDNKTVGELYSLKRLCTTTQIVDVLSTLFSQNLKTESNQPQKREISAMTASISRLKKRKMI